MAQLPPFQVAETDTFIHGGGGGQGASVLECSLANPHTSVTRSSRSGGVSDMAGLLLVMTNEVEEQVFLNCRYLLCTPTMPLTSRATLESL